MLLLSSSLWALAAALLQLITCVPAAFLPDQTPLTNGLETLRTSKKIPVWAVAHRVSYTTSVDIALSHGANAIETDMCPYEEGWYANHDCASSSSSAGKESAADLFRVIGQRRRAGHTIGFVFLDLKSATCRSTPACSIPALQSLAQEYLEPYGVRVLYSFTDPDNLVAFRSIGFSLTSNEAVSVNRPFGGAEKILSDFEGQGKAIPTDKRVMDKGVSVFQDIGFGHCSGRGIDQEKICSQLIVGAKIRDEQHKFARVFTWTTTPNTENLANMLLDKSGVDGILYGHGTREYDASARPAALEIINWVWRNSDSYYLATNSDIPW
jgi:hypothetical protein